MDYAALFPGQGSQHVGMGDDLFDTRPDLLGDAADDVLGWSLRQLCLEGPEEDLTRTERAQPALYATSYAAWTVFSEEAPPPAAAAGHSLGEYTALAAAGVFSFLDGLALVAARGKAMAAAADREPSAMAALIGGDDEAAEALTAARRADGGRLWVANLNAPGQVAVAGGADDVAWAVTAGPDHGVRRVVPLKVAGAFHTPFMDSAANELAAAIDQVAFNAPAFPVWSNTTAAPHGDDIAAALVAQLTSPVRFTETLEGLAATGLRTFVHVGPGDVTAGLVRRSVPDAATHVVSSAAAATEVARGVAS